MKEIFLRIFPYLNFLYFCDNWSDKKITSLWISLFIIPKAIIMVYGLYRHFKSF